MTLEAEGHRGVLPTDLLCLACSAWFFTHARTSTTGVVPPIVCWTLSHQPLVKKMPHRLAYRPGLWRQVFNDSFLSDDSNLCGANTNLSRTPRDPPASTSPVQELQGTAASLLYDVVGDLKPGQPHAYRASTLPTEPFSFQLKN